MNQKFLKITVTKSDGTSETFNPASPQMVMACLELYHNTGDTLTIEVCEMTVETPAK